MCCTEKNTILQKEFLMEVRHLAVLHSTDGVFYGVLCRNNEFQDKAKLALIFFIL